MPGGGTRGRSRRARRDRSGRGRGGGIDDGVPHGSITIVAVDRELVNARQTRIYTLCPARVSGYCIWYGQLLLNSLGLVYPRTNFPQNVEFTLLYMYVRCGLICLAVEHNPL